MGRATILAGGHTVPAGAARQSHNLPAETGRRVAFDLLMATVGNADAVQGHRLAADRRGGLC